MVVSLVGAYSKKTRGIGFKNSLPWKTTLIGDLRIFIYTTKMVLNLDTMRFEKPKSKPMVLMGRKTYDSLKELGAVPLKGRDNIVITRSPSLVDCKDALPITNMCDFLKKNTSEYISIIGGEQIYRDSIINGHVDYLILTEVSHDDDLEFDTYLCEIPEDKYVFKSDITSLIVSEMRNSPCVPPVNKNVIGELEESLRQKNVIAQNGFKYRVLLYINQTYINKENH